MIRWRAGSSTQRGPSASASQRLQAGRRYNPRSVAVTEQGRRTALVTGASSGIGEAIARRLAARGTSLLLCARRRDRLETLASDLRAKHGVVIEVVEADLTSDGVAADLARRAAEHGPIDVLVNNAGAGAFGKFADLPLDAQLALVRINVMALVELTGHVLPGMAARGHGAILNIASTSGFQPLAYNAVYAATKAFVVSFGEALAVEQRGSGIDIVTLCPGITETEFFVAASRVGETFRPSGTLSMSADRVADYAMRALDRKSALAFAGAHNWLTTFLVRLAPRSWVRAVAGSVFRWMLARQAPRR